MTDVESSRPRDELQDGNPSPAAVAQRRAVAYALLLSGILFVAGVPLLVIGGDDPASDASIVIAQAGQRDKPGAAATGTPAPTATDAPAPAATTTDAPGEVQAPTPSPAAKAGGAAHRPLEGRWHHGEPVPPAEVECKPVRRDDSVGKSQFPVPLPPFSDQVYPCTRCHDKPEDYNETKRNLTLEHMYIKLVHGPREQWCYGCHNPTNRDELRLAGGRTVTFLESYELCGQCHGPKLRDWRLGIHGRRTGCWNGQKEYLLCVHCHNPHAPEFKSLTPMPRPKKPTELGREGN